MVLARRYTFYMYQFIFTEVVYDLTGCNTNDQTTKGVIQIMEAPHYNKRSQKEGTAQFTGDCQPDGVASKNFITFNMHLTVLLNYIAFSIDCLDCRRLARKPFYTNIA